MTKKLEELFDLAPTEDDVNVSVPAIAENKSQLAALDDAIDKIDNALPAVRGLDATDQEMDELAGLATGTYKDLMDLGFEADAPIDLETHLEKLPYYYPLAYRSERN